jgi:hypothetical protein
MPDGGLSGADLRFGALHGPGQQSAQGAGTPTTAGDATPEADSAAWVSALVGSGEVAIVRFHELLLRTARSEVRRRSGRLRFGGKQLHNIVHQTAADALVAIIAKIGSVPR